MPGEHQRVTLTGAAVGVGIATDPAALSVFLQPGCAAAIWFRHPPRNVQTWLDTLDPDLLPRGRVTLPVNRVEEAVQQLCDISRLPNGPERDWLQSDIARLARIFADLMPAPYLKVRLDVVTTNACRKFHIDAVTARLVCTYRGTGTQYGISTDGQDPKRVFTAQTGAPILLRGTLWPEHPPSRLLHRSPPIEGSGETRLLLVLDPVHDHGEDF